MYVCKLFNRIPLANMYDIYIPLIDNALQCQQNVDAPSQTQNNRQ